MSGFETHLRWGLATHAVLVAATASAYLLGACSLGPLALVCVSLPATLAGALFPDLDHQASIPHRYGADVCPVLVAAVALVVGLRYRPAIAATVTRATGRPGAFLGGVVVASLAWSAWVGTRRLFPVLRPTHRTVTHRLSTGVVVALCVGAVVSLLLGTDGSVGAPVRAVALTESAAFLLGFLSHLGADGLHREYSERVRALVWRRSDA
ncbi:metal-dependent hydrolase (plasmid) [Halarchaeum sp. CBA1220]|uniref:metal-dependent hydrolase n=1 Tax=Halarchaeum sp. CBA1220 TaxID=1853682 RepID=UPI000F3A8374|nr:metal-dependent hydrolase [Halarchaeum sp. CBA1220]QLC35125.1 metal-dependent hydrolase [Halarchaeum sp. CBA1220]